MLRHLSIAARMAFITILAYGVIYPLAITAVSHMLFPKQSGGSIIYVKGQPVGSELIAQRFSSSRYFHARPSAIDSNYRGDISGGSNYGPTSKQYYNTIKQRDQQLTHQYQNLKANRIPIDMITASGSGLDPDISLANALTQVPEVAKARNLPVSEVNHLVERMLIPRTLGFIGEPRINVLKTNLALDQMCER